MDYVKISIYISEADKWQHHPLYMALLTLLHDNKISGGTVMHGVAGFSNKGLINSALFVDAGVTLPLVLQFVDTIKKVEAVLPKVKEMVGDNLVIREPVNVV